MDQNLINTDWINKQGPTPPNGLTIRKLKQIMGGNNEALKSRMSNDINKLWLSYYTTMRTDNKDEFGHLKSFNYKNLLIKKLNNRSLNNRRLNIIKPIQFDFLNEVTVKAGGNKSNKDSKTKKRKISKNSKTKKRKSNKNSKTKKRKTLKTPRSMILNNYCSKTPQWIKKIKEMIGGDFNFLFLKSNDKVLNNYIKEYNNKTLSDKDVLPPDVIFDLNLEYPRINDVEQNIKDDEFYCNENYSNKTWQPLQENKTFTGEIKVYGMQEPSKKLEDKLKMLCWLMYNRKIGILISFQHDGLEEKLWFLLAYIGIINKYSLPKEINYYNIEIIDWTPPTTLQSNKLLDILDKYNSDIVFHCLSGFGRTGSMMFLSSEYKNTILYYNDVIDNEDNLKAYYIVPEYYLEKKWKTDDKIFKGKNPGLKYLPHNDSGINVIYNDIKSYYPNANYRDYAGDAAEEFINVETPALFELLIQRINNTYLAIAYHLKKVGYFKGHVYVRQYKMLNRKFKPINLLREWYSNVDNQSFIII